MKSITKIQRAAMFRKGMVVAVRGQGLWVRLRSSVDRQGTVLVEGHPKESWLHISEIRNLTNREIGGPGTYFVTLRL